MACNFEHMLPTSNQKSSTSKQNDPETTKVLAPAGRKHFFAKLTNCFCFTFQRPLFPHLPRSSPLFSLATLGSSSLVKTLQQLSLSSNIFLKKISTPFVYSSFTQVLFVSAAVQSGVGSARAANVTSEFSKSAVATSNKTKIETPAASGAAEPGHGAPHGVGVGAAEVAPPPVLIWIAQDKKKHC